MRNTGIYCRQLSRLVSRYDFRLSTDHVGLLLLLLLLLLAVGIATGHQWRLLLWRILVELLFGWFAGRRRCWVDQSRLTGARAGCRFSARSPLSSTSQRKWWNILVVSGYTRNIGIIEQLNSYWGCLNIESRVLRLVTRVLRLETRVCIDSILDRSADSSRLSGRHVLLYWVQFNLRFI